MFGYSHGKYKYSMIRSPTILTTVEWLKIDKFLNAFAQIFHESVGLKGLLIDFSLLIHCTILLYYVKSA